MQLHAPCGDSETVDVPEPTPPHAADLELVTAALAREPRALAALGRRMDCITPFLSVLARRAASTLADHELRDLAQDVAVALLEYLQRYRGGSTLETLIWRICTNRLQNRLRDRSVAQWRERALADVEEPSHVPLSDADPLLSTDLSPDEKQIVRMHVLEEVSLASIARGRGVSASTLKSKYYAARDRLRSHV